MNTKTRREGENTFYSKYTGAVVFCEREMYKEVFYLFR